MNSLAPIYHDILLRAAVIPVGMGFVQSFFRNTCHRRAKENPQGQKFWALTLETNQSYIIAATGVLYLAFFPFLLPQADGRPVALILIAAFTVLGLYEILIGIRGALEARRTLHQEAG